MGGRGTISGLTPDKDQVDDLIAEARSFAYKTLRYTDSTGRQRDIRVNAQGSGTMSASYDPQIDTYVRLAANVGINRLQQDLSAKISSYQTQAAKGQALQNLSPAKAKAARTRAAKLGADIRALQAAIRIAQRRGYDDDVF